MTHPLHAAPAVGDIMAEHRTKGHAGHAVTGEFDAEDEGEAVLGASEAPIIEGRVGTFHNVILQSKHHLRQPVLSM